MRRTIPLLLALALSAFTVYAEEKASPALSQLVESSRGAAPDVPEAAGAPIKLAAASRKAGSSGAVMLQGFHWESHQAYPWWGILSSKASAIAAAGVDIVWFPPSSEAQSDEGYLPSRLYVQTSRYGTQDQLKKAISSLHSNGVKAIADMVLNHRVGTKDWGDFTEPAWGPESVCGDDEWVGARGGRDTGKGFHAGRDIDHANPVVQKSVAEWMNWLRKDIGYDGWRYDYVRGFASKHLAQYHDATSPSFAVGEVWDDFDSGNPDAHRQKLCDWLDSMGGRSSVFDFTTKALLQQAVSSGEYWRLGDRQGKPAGLIGWWPAKAVTFLDNHDTGASTGGPGQNLWPFPGDKIMQGYAYILTHPGVPCLYWPHLFDWGLYDQLKALGQLRQAAGITSTSSVQILAADGSKYAAIVGGKLAVKIGPGSWSPGEGWSLSAYGKDYAVWSK